MFHVATYPPVDAAYLQAPFLLLPHLRMKISNVQAYRN